MLIIVVGEFEYFLIFELPNSILNKALAECKNDMSLDQLRDSYKYYMEMKLYSKYLNDHLTSFTNVSPYNPYFWIQAHYLGSN
jgi:hypothetical protein